MPSRLFAVCDGRAVNSSPHLPPYHSLRIFSGSPAVQGAVQHGENTGAHTGAGFLPPLTGGRLLKYQHVLGRV